MSEWKHGTHGTYTNGCRCDNCRLANNAYKRELYHRNISQARKYCREKMRRYARRSVIGNEDQALINRAEAMRAAEANAEGELAELIREQRRDDTKYVTRHPLIARSLDETRFNGWGERAPA